MFPFYSLWKYQKNKGFQVFSGGVVLKYSPEMPYENPQGTSQHHKNNSLEHWIIASEPPQ